MSTTVGVRYSGVVVKSGYTVHSFLSSEEMPSLVLVFTLIDGRPQGGDEWY